MRVQIHHLVSEAAAARGDAPALTFKDVTLTYEQLWRDVTLVGEGLARLGLRRNDRVAVYLDKRIETVTAVFGTAAATGVFVPINPLLRPRQVGYILRDCDVRVLVTTHERLELLRSELEQTKSLDVVVVVGATPRAGDDQERTVAPDEQRYRTLPWTEMTAAQPSGAGAVTVGPRYAGSVIDTDMAAILYTSGSTGSPKGVVLSHRNLIAGAESVSQYLGNTADDVILSVLPLSFDAGFSQLTTAFSVGAHVVLLNYLLASDVVRLVGRHGVTGLTCVPPLWIQIAEQEWPPEIGGRLRYFANTGGRMPKATLDRLRGIFPKASPYLMYGLTEAFRSTYLDPAEVDRRPDSIGKAIPNAEILVVRPDGTECGPGEEGELVHRGALVSLGYWNDAERTAERFRPAPAREPGVVTTEISVWSGDQVVRDEEGFLYFVGRKDEMIKTSGYRVSPSEVEEAAYDSGWVRDAVAIGVDDARLGQHIVLVVSPSPGQALDSEALLAQLRKTLPLYMVPRRVETRPEIPRSPNGKFDRAMLREELSS
jgi:acyl-CoA ligase (AMP-forming) (exosortase A-associated)